LPASIPDALAMTPKLRHLARTLFWPLGIDVHKFEPSKSPVALRRQLFQTFQIDTVLDVGANVGQFAGDLREDVHFTGRICSFEPLSSAYSILEAKARKDPKWQTFNYALGNAEEKKTIHIANNSQSSSLLAMLPAHVQSAPESRYVAQETITVRKLDSIYPELCSQSRNIFLKIDTQGYESFVLEGAARSLPLIHTLQLELSNVPLYDGQLLFHELYSMLAKTGYSLVAIEPGFTAPTGEILQLDGIFHKY
jgi:FkbM family methyltransferase